MPTSHGSARRAADVYAIYGTALASRHPFTFNLLLCDAAPEVWFEVVEQAPLPTAWDAAPPRFDGRHRGVGSDIVGAVFEVDDCLVARFTGRADFFVWPDRIACHLHDERYWFAIEIWLFGTVLALWLERRGLLTLHAAAAVIGNSGAAFLSTNKGGKSTLAAGLVQRGARLLTDDILALESGTDRVLGRPGYPQMRFWPEQARAVLGSADGLDRVQPGSSKLRVPIGPAGFGAFQPRAVPMVALYLPERGASQAVEIEPLPLADSLTCLVRHSFLVGVMEALGMAPARFRTFAALVQQVPLRRLRYPTGMPYLVETCVAVERDIARLLDDPLLIR